MTDQSHSFIVAVAAIITKGDRLLAMKRSPNKDAGPNLWESLSGRVEHHEEPYDAIKREVLEECGLEVEIEERPVDVYMSKRLGHPMLLLVYKAKHLSKEVKLSSEHTEYRWVTIDEFERLTPLKRLVKAAKKAFALESKVGA